MSWFPGCATCSAKQTPVTVSVGGTAPVRDLGGVGGGAAGGRPRRFFNAHFFTGGGERAEQVFATLRDLGRADPAVDR